jgi:predicted transcriptional regulator of viral defense system
MSETETFCQKCGAQREPTTTGQSLDDKVYSYIVEHSGVISLKQAAGDLGITPQELKEVTERLKQQGRLA